MLSIADRRGAGSFRQLQPPLEESTPFVFDANKQLHDWDVSAMLFCKFGFLSVCFALPWHVGSSLLVLLAHLLLLLKMCMRVCVHTNLYVPQPSLLQGRVMGHVWHKIESSRMFKRSRKTGTCPILSLSLSCVGVGVGVGVVMVCRAFEEVISASFLMLFGWPCALRAAEYQCLSCHMTVEDVGADTKIRSACRPTFSILNEYPPREKVSACVNGCMCEYVYV